MKKLTPAMELVITLMRDGWHLGAESTFDARCWLQQGELGRGGKARNVHSSTFHGLADRGLIVQGEPHFPTTEWHLAEPPA